MISWWPLPRLGVVAALVAATACGEAVASPHAVRVVPPPAAQGVRVTVAGGGSGIDAAGTTPARSAPRDALPATVALENGAVRREWRVVAGPSGGIATTSLKDVATGTDWIAGRSDDFALTVDGITLVSSSGWPVCSVHTERSSDAARAVVDLRTSVAGASIEVLRSYTLHRGSAVIETDSVLVNRSPLPVRVGAHTLDEVTSATGGPAEVDAYRGGSDWQDSFRTTTVEAGAFDREGEVARFGNGMSGWFIVAERRGGAASRAGRASRGGVWRTYAGADPARDLLDLGPVTAPGTTDNRVTNPLYPVPVRERNVSPGQSLELGRAYTGVYHGGPDAAAAAFAADFNAHRRPPVGHTVDQNTFHPYGHGPALSDPTMRREALASRALGVQVFMLDDQWQGSSAGDWEFDPARFPDSDGDGTPDFVEGLHATGMQLGLWMSPLEFNPRSRAYSAHPEWACTPLGDVTAHVRDDSGLGVWDVTNPGFRAYIENVIDRAIVRWGVVEFKFDFMTWVDCPPRDYLDYEDAFVAMVRDLEARHPDVAFELDETNDQRSWPFESASLGASWFDNDHTHGSTVVAKQLHDLWSAAPWMPPSSLGLGLYDGTLVPPYTAQYLMSIAVLSHVTIWTDTTLLAPTDAAETAWWIAWYRQHHDDLAGLVYEDSTPDPLDGRSTLALQPWTGDHGYLFVFRQSGGAPVETVALRGVQAAHAYRLTDVRTGADLGVRTGDRLLSGLSVAVPRAYTSAVIAVDPV